METVKNFFRWIGFIPLAFLGCFVAFEIARMFLSFPWWVLGINHDAPIFKIMEVSASGVSGYFFVAIGGKVSPSGKTAVVYLLTAAAFLLSGMSLFIFLNSGQYFEVMKVTSVAIGAMVMLYMYNTGEETLD